MTHRNEYYEYDAPHRRNKSYSHRRVYQEGPIQTQTHYHQGHHHPGHMDYRNSYEVTNAPHVETYNEYSLDKNHHFNNYGMQELKRENKQLKNELHRLRKVEASFLNGKKTKVIEKVHTRNHHYHDDKLRVENNLQTLHAERDVLNKQIHDLRIENDDLLNRIALLEKEKNDLADLHGRHQTEITTIHTDYKNRHNDYETQLNSLRAEN